MHAVCRREEGGTRGRWGGCAKNSGGRPHHALALDAHFLAQAVVEHDLDHGGGGGAGGAPLTSKKKN